MSEEKFVYEYFSALSHNFAAWSLLYAGYFSISFSDPWIAFAALALLVPIVLFPLFRGVKFVRSHKAIPNHLQKRIIKRHRFSLKWIWMILCLSATIPFTLALFLELDLLRLAALSGLTAMCGMFVLLRVFLRQLQQRIDVATPS